MCPLLVPGFQGFFFVMRPLTELMKQTRQAGRAIKQSILLRCLCYHVCDGFVSTIHSIDINREHSLDTYDIKETVS
jgi:hypothetical protein